MKSIEEQLWAYIDGSCAAADEARIARLIETDQAWRQQYEELIALNNEFKTIELDEPPMAFTYHVMEQIRVEEAAVPLKAGINKRIIWGIAALFIVTISALLVMAMQDINWAANDKTAFEIPAPISKSLSGFLGGPWVKGFVFFDVIFGLYFLDYFLRKRNNTHQEEGQL